MCFPFCVHPSSRSNVIIYHQQEVVPMMLAYMSKGKDWKKNLEEIWKVQKTLEPHLNSCNLCRCMRKGMAGRWFQSQLPFLSPGFLFTLRIKKEVMLLYSKPFKSATGCLCIRSLNALTEEMSENCHHPLISFKTST